MKNLIPIFTLALLMAFPSQISAQSSGIGVSITDGINSLSDPSLGGTTGTLKCTPRLKPSRSTKWSQKVSQSDLNLSQVDWSMLKMRAAQLGRNFFIDRVRITKTVSSTCSLYYIKANNILEPIKDQNLLDSLRDHHIVQVEINTTKLEYAKARKTFFTSELTTKTLTFNSYLGTRVHLAKQTRTAKTEIPADLTMFILETRSPDTGEIIAETISSDFDIDAINESKFYQPVMFFTDPQSLPFDRDDIILEYKFHSIDGSHKEIENNSVIFIQESGTGYTNLSQTKIAIPSLDVSQNYFLRQGLYKFDEYQIPGSPAGKYSILRTESGIMEFSNRHAVSDQIILLTWELGEEGVRSDRKLPWNSSVELYTAQWKVPDIQYEYEPIIVRHTFKNLETGKDQTVPYSHYPNPINAEQYYANIEFEEKKKFTIKQTEDAIANTKKFLDNFKGLPWNSMGDFSDPSDKNDDISSIDDGFL